MGPWVMARIVELSRLIEVHSMWWAYSFVPQIYWRGVRREPCRKNSYCRGGRGWKRKRG